MKILIFFKNWIGDVFFQYPALEVIRRDSPTAEIICAAPERCHEILKAHPAVNRVLLFDEKKQHRTLFSKLNFAGFLRRERIDRAYLFHRSKTRALLTWAAGIRERIGFGKNRGLWLTLPVTEPADPMTHQADTFLLLLQGAGHKVELGAPYRFYVPEASRETLAAKTQFLMGQPYVCFHLGANWEAKRWPVARFAELADQIAQRWKVVIVVTGAGSDRPLFEDFERRVKFAKVYSFIGQTTLSELAALFQKAALVVSGDSGPMHLASGVGANLVALFGPTHPGLTGPRGPGKSAVISFIPQGLSAPWYGQHIPAEEWLGQISADEVMRVMMQQPWMENIPRSS